MYQIARIIFTPQNSENALDTIDHLLHILVQNGQIVGQWIVEKQGNAYHATVTLSDEDALEERYHNLYFKEISKGVDISVQIIGEDPFASDSCHCKEHDFSVLAFDPDAVSSPVYCADCGKKFRSFMFHISLEKRSIYRSWNGRKIVMPFISCGSALCQTDSQRIRSSIPIPY